MLSGTKPEYPRKYNRRITIETIRRNSPISRAEIAQMTGLTTATISNITSELLEEEIILETGRRKGQRGQPAIDLELNPAGRFSIGFELGRDLLAGVAINLTGEILQEIYEEWEYPAPEVALPLMSAKLYELMSKTGIPEKRLLGIGVAMPGPFLTNKKRTVYPINFPHWEQFPVVEKMREAFGFPIIMENDAMAAALGERFHGLGRHYKDFYYIHLGAGIGGAMILQGHPYQGFSPNTGELGWMTYGLKGRRALVGQYVGLKPLYDFLRGYGIAISHLRDLEELFAQQNPHLWEWLNESVDCLTTVLDAINAILGPEAVFLGGHVPNVILDYLIERLNIEIAAARAAHPDQHVMYQIKLLRTTSGDLSSAIGAATLPLYKLFSI
ncbi:MAG: ROK family transcriptional regulator [Candidatus Vecturithrix sp.]|jgi:predicted NBD/HSP70 family sugar kinase|nr:ROK family transcriptional regulator [Candidatus Vecturithrix sp.]